MLDALAVTEAGMLNDVQRLHAISHNVANAGTVGFKREVVATRTFSDYIGNTAAVSEASAARSDVPTTTVHVDHHEGALKYSGNPLDVALEGGGLFVVSTPFGEAYTRQGNFRTDANGRLVTAAGDPVVGVEGEIRLTTPEPRIDSEGYVWESATRVGQFKLVSTKEMHALERAGNGLLLASESSTMTVAEGVRTRQGFTEMSNVIAMNEMIKMIETVRHFEASQRLMRGYDAMLDKAINVAGEV